MRPEHLALRTINQYRTRDITAYLGLRYYFANQCAVRDRWANEVASHLVLNRGDGVYFRSLHFKELLSTGKVDHRDIFLPGPNESFAESALLAECAKHLSFRQHPFVFSYRLSDDGDTQGVFKPYFIGLQERQNKIAAVCRARPDFVVRYTDIKRFYPNIQGKLALDAWIKACSSSAIPARFRDLGSKLLSDYERAGRRANYGQGLLTGPMFSHLIANLLLRGVDEEMSALFPERYFRYVDDVVLVGTQAEILKGYLRLAELLNELSLELHDGSSGKDFDLGANEWINQEDDFFNKESQHWMLFVRDLKQCLVSRASSHSTLTELFSSDGFRIPLSDYYKDVSDAGYLDRLLARIEKYHWLPAKIIKSTPSQLFLFAQKLRKSYSEQLDRLFDANPNAKVYSRKRAISKMRYLVGRLIYLGQPDSLAKLSDRLNSYPELVIHAETIKALISRDVTQVLSLGSNAAQSAAQILKLTTGEVSCSLDAWSAVELQGLAIFRANGISISGPSDDELNRFALWKKDGNELMRSRDAFIQEMACLHGVAKSPRHKAILDSAFDRKEELAFDATTPVDTY